jgi:hypothetical protein
MTDFQVGKYMIARLAASQGKTSVYHILSVKDGTRLSTVKWHFPWRQYVSSLSDELLQKPGEELLFNAGCHEEIAKFLRKLNEMEHEQLRTKLEFSK